MDDKTDVTKIEDEDSSIICDLKEMIRHDPTLSSLSSNLTAVSVKDEVDLVHPAFKIEDENTSSSVSDVGSFFIGSDSGNVSFASNITKPIKLPNIDKDNPVAMDTVYDIPPAGHSKVMNPSVGAPANSMNFTIIPPVADIVTSDSQHNYSQQVRMAVPRRNSPITLSPVIQSNVKKSNVPDIKVVGRYSPLIPNMKTVPAPGGYSHPNNMKFNLPSAINRSYSASFERIEPRDDQQVLSRMQQSMNRGRRSDVECRGSLDSPPVHPPASSTPTTDHTPSGNVVRSQSSMHKMLLLKTTTSVGGGGDSSVQSPHTLSPPSRNTMHSLSPSPIYFNENTVGSNDSNDEVLSRSAPQADSGFWGGKSCDVGGVVIGGNTLDTSRSPFIIQNSQKRNVPFSASTSSTWATGSSIWNTHRKPRNHISSVCSVNESLIEELDDVMSRLSNEGDDFGSDDNVDSIAHKKISIQSYDDKSDDSGDETSDAYLCGSLPHSSKSMSNYLVRPASSASTRPSDLNSKHFWQYNVQSKGPKGHRFWISESSIENPHEPKAVVDPVFHGSVATFGGIKHSGKARRGEGNDLTPNPEKLAVLGRELEGWNQRISAVSSGHSQNTSFTQNCEDRKKKNTMASRACRLKKKAQHEANKIKCEGLTRENDALLKVIEDGKRILQRKIDICGSSTLQDQFELTNRLQKLVSDTKREQISGRTSEYVSVRIQPLMTSMHSSPPSSSSATFTHPQSLP